MMRIAVYHNLPSGGAKRSLQEQLKRLGKRHHLEVFTLSSAEGEFADLRPFTAQHHVFDFKPLPLFRSPFGRLNQVLRLLDLRRLGRLNQTIGRRISSEGYDLAYINPCQFENAPSVLRYLPATPSIFYCQEPLRLVYEPMPARPYDPDAAPGRRLLNRLDPLPGAYRRAARRNDQTNVHRAGRVLVNSQFIRAAAQQIYGLDPTVCYLGVDANQFRPIALPKRDFLFSVGSLTPLKGVDFLIEALAKVPEGQRPELVIASNFQNAAERVFLHELAIEKKVALKLLHNVTDAQLVGLYNQACLTVYAPVREPFGFVSLETMACETPLVAVREGGVQETVLHEETGLLVERDPKQFAEAVCSLTADPRLRRQMGKAGRDHVLKRWTWEQSVERLEGQFSEVVGGR